VTYRVSLHLLAALWNILLFLFSLSRQKKEPYYKPLGLFCFFTAIFNFSWGLGILYESLFWMRMTWLGMLMPIALFSLLNPLFKSAQPKFFTPLIWTVGWITAILGLSPWVIVSMDQYTPHIRATMGPLELPLRITLLILILGIMAAYVKYWASAPPEIQHRTKFILLGCLIYGGGAGLTCSITPLLGEQKYLEWTSFGSVIWTTLATWHVLTELQKQEEDLTALDKMKRNLINHITHEFRTPLNAIESAADILKDRGQKSDYVDMIQKNVDRLKALVNAFLDLAAIQNTKVKLNKEKLDLKELAKDTFSLIQASAEKAGVQFEITGPSVQVEGDKEKLQQVLINILSNAVKAAPQGEISIETSSDEEKVTLKVSDTGSGVLEGDLERIFSSFYQAQKSSLAGSGTAGKGSGLGLAIAKGWVEAHGGKIWAESEGPGKGTTVCFTLPKGTTLST